MSEKADTTETARGNGTEKRRMTKAPGGGERRMRRGEGRRGKEREAGGAALGAIAWNEPGVSRLNLLEQASSEWLIRTAFGGSI